MLDERGSLVTHMVEEYGVSRGRTCKTLSLPRSTQSYKPRPKADAEVIDLQMFVEMHPAIGFWQSYYRIRRKGFVWNHKRVYRIYTEMKLNLRSHLQTPAAKG